ncbi:MAG TPA: hypothetical protein VGM93_11435 [Acidimicrobiales bacterium]
MSSSRVKPVLVVVLLLFVAGAAGCAKAKHDQAARAAVHQAAPADFVAKASDFVPLKEMTHVRGFFLANRRGHLAQTLAIARANRGGTYPVGTIVQLVPQEAMVKRRAGFDPASDDWEFFELDVSKAGTTIHQRGGAEVMSRFGVGSCSSCHSVAGKKYDFVCETTHGCAPLPIGRDTIDKIQASDPRPLTSS